MNSFFEKKFKERRAARITRREIKLTPTQKAAAKLKNNPDFEAFLECVWEVRETSVHTAYDPRNIIHPEVQAFSAGCIYVCDCILDSAQI